MMPPLSAFWKTLEPARQMSEYTTIDEYFASQHTLYGVNEETQAGRSAVTVRTWNLYNLYEKDTITLYKFTMDDISYDLEKEFVRGKTTVQKSSIVLAENPLRIMSATDIYTKTLEGMVFNALSAKEEHETLAGAM